MSKNVISVENLSKSYRLGVIGTGTFSNDLKVWWARMRGKPNPLLKIGQEDHGNRVGEELWALKDVSFQVEQGEVLGIIGRNGAGKSTLLKILSRVTAPTSGTVKVKGRIASLLEVGTGFHPELTGRENIYLNGAILGMTKAEVNRRFDEIVEFAEIAKFIDTPVKRYSSGMYVRLAFAVAAHLDPEILIVDEVLAVGDAEFQKKCLGKMENVASEGRTVLFVSHNMSAIKQLCSCAIVLEHGSIQAEGNTLETIEEYQGISSNDSSRKIIDHIKIKEHDLTITEVQVNGQSNDHLQILHQEKSIAIKVTGFIQRNLRLEIEFRLLDQFDNVLAFFSPGHLSGATRVFPRGSFEIERRAKLPRGINKGTYYLSIYLTDPDKAGLAEMIKAVKIEHEGFRTNTGRSFTQGSSEGWLLLEEDL